MASDKQLALILQPHLIAALSAQARPNPRNKCNRKSDKRAVVVLIETQALQGCSSNGREHWNLTSFVGTFVHSEMSRALEQHTSTCSLQQYLRVSLTQPQYR